MRKLAFISVIVVAMTAAAVIERGAVTITSAQSRTPRYGFWGVALDARDLTVKPGDDFFRHVNGVWYDKTEIPADKSSIGLATILADEVELQVRAIVEDSVKSQDPAAKQLAAFWASWMDEAGIEARRNKALEPYLANVAAVQTRDDLLRLFTDPGYTAPIDVFIRPDPGQPNRYIAFATQGGLGMPNRDYYLREGEKYESLRKAYRHYVVRMQALAGIENAEAKADAIMALETALAKSHWPPERSRDVEQTYNPMNREELTTLAPEFDWTMLLERLQLGAVDTVMARETSAIADAGRMLSSVPLDTWKDYSAHHFIRGHARVLGFDPVSWTLSERRIRCPHRWQKLPRGDERVAGSTTTLKRRPSGWYTTKAKASARSLVTLI